MKRIFLVALSATLLTASCQKTEVLNPVGDEITFSTKMGKLTKSYGTADADNDGNANLKAQDFRIWAYCDYDDPYTTTVNEFDTIYDGINGTNVAYANETNTWAPVDDYYWPGTGKNLRFFAVSGEGTEATVTPAIGRAGNSVSPTLTITNYVVNHAAPNTDLMVADFVCQNQETPDVKLDFRHALSKVEFKFKTLGGMTDSVYVQSLSVAGINTKANLVVSAASANEESPKERFVWVENTISEPKTFNDDWNKNAEKLPAEIEHIGETTKREPDDKTVLHLNERDRNFCTWLTLPQSIEGKTLRVVYVIGERQFESYFQLDKGITKWDVNQYIRYIITLAPNKISFDTSVDEWDVHDDDTMTDGNQDIEFEN